MTTSRRSKTQQLEGAKSEERRKPTKEEEEDCTVETVLEIETNILTIRCYVYRLKFEFTFVVFIVTLYVHSHPEGRGNVT